MSNRVRLTWPPRVRQPRRPVTITKHAPHDIQVFGPPITNTELLARLTGKAY